MTLKGKPVPTNVLELCVDNKLALSTKLYIIMYRMLICGTWKHRLASRTINQHLKTQISTVNLSQRHSIRKVLKSTLETFNFYTNNMLACRYVWYRSWIRLIGPILCFYKYSGRSVIRTSSGIDKKSSVCYIECLMKKMEISFVAIALCMGTSQGSCTKSLRQTMHFNEKLINNGFEF